VSAAAAVAATSSLLTIRTFCPPRDYSGTFQPRVSSLGHSAEPPWASAERAQLQRSAWPQRNGQVNSR
jgi:hypothetical protein